MGIEEYLTEQCSELDLKDEKQRIKNILKEAYHVGPIYSFRLMIESIKRGYLLPPNERSKFLLYHQSLASYLS